MGTIIVIVILAVIIAAAAFSTIKHMKGQSGCCGCSGGCCTAGESKKLDTSAVGEKIIRIEGMHCDNCKNSIERAINRIDGVVCKVNLKKKLAVVSYSKEPSDEELSSVVEGLDFTVTGITKN
ncbi:MAG: heavy-metal-associated domain-containing protein [Lachnospiraceae bacterium]|nr:heavy-metal-associated domain-containing protein [Lachnospiraceae bacterium]